MAIVSPQPKSGWESFILSEHFDDFVFLPQMNKLETENSPVGRLLPEDRALQSRQHLPGRVGKSKSHTHTKL